DDPHLIAPKANPTKKSHAKAQRRKESRSARDQFFFASLRLCVLPFFFSCLSCISWTVHEFGSVGLSGRLLHLLSVGGAPGALQDKPAQVFVLGHRFELRADEFAIDRDLFLTRVGGLVADLFEESLHNRVQASGADVLR